MTALIRLLFHRIVGCRLGLHELHDSYSQDTGHTVHCLFCPFSRSARPAEIEG